MIVSVTNPTVIKFIESSLRTDCYLQKLGVFLNTDDPFQLIVQPFKPVLELLTGINYDTNNQVCARIVNLYLDAMERLADDKTNFEEEAKTLATNISNISNMLNN